jgi:hypothetical protein
VVCSPLRRGASTTSAKRATPPPFLVEGPTFDTSVDVTGADCRNCDTCGGVADLRALCPSARAHVEGIDWHNPLHLSRIDCDSLRSIALTSAAHFRLGVAHTAGTILGFNTQATRALDFAGPDTVLTYG